MANRGDPRLKRAYRDGFRTKILQRDGYVCFTVAKMQTR